MWHKSTWIRASIVAPVAFFYLSFLCVLNESSNCLTFLHHELPRVSSNCLHERIQSHIGCICLTFLHCAFSNISSKCLYESRRSHTDCICLIFLHCVLSNIIKILFIKSLMHLDQSMQIFFLCVFLQMHAQIACTRGCIVAIAAFDWFIFAVCSSLLLNLLI